MGRKYYEAYDERYSQIHSLGLQWFDDQPSGIVLEIIKKYYISKNAPILEIGCGEGRDASVLLNLGYDLTATDISHAAILFCREKYPVHADRFRVLDCISESIPQKFDFVYAVAVIHMLVEDTDRAAFYRFIRNHLSDKGIALICSMGDGKTELKTDILKAFELHSRTHEQTGREVQVANTSCRMVNEDTFSHEIKEASLSILDMGFTSVLPDFPWMMYAVVTKQEK